SKAQRKARLHRNIVCGIEARTWKDMEFITRGLNSLGVTVMTTMFLSMVTDWTTGSIHSRAEQRTTTAVYFVL
ncbi:hypothetical protein STEG23_031817, partial [Scotinomys teguina]